MITLVYDKPNGDWVALYRDGLLVEQGHSFEETQLLRLAEVEHEVVWDGDAGATANHFPTHLSDVVKVSNAPKLPADRVPDVDEKFQTEAGEVKRFGDFNADDLRAAMTRIREEDGQ